MALRGAERSAARTINNARSARRADAAAARGRLADAAHAHLPAAGELRVQHRPGVDRPDAQLGRHGSPTRLRRALRTPCARLAGEGPHRPPDPGRVRRHDGLLGHQLRLPGQRLPGGERRAGRPAAGASRIDVGSSTSSIDSAGNLWGADTGLFNPTTAIAEGPAGDPIAATADDRLYANLPRQRRRRAQDQRVLTFTIPRVSGVNRVDVRLLFRRAGSTAHQDGGSSTSPPRTSCGSTTSISSRGPAAATSPGRRRSAICRRPRRGADAPPGGERGLPVALGHRGALQRRLRDLSGAAGRSTAGRSCRAARRGGAR